MSALDEVLKRHKPTCASLHGWSCNCGADKARAELTALRARVAQLEEAATNLFQACADLPMPEMDRMEKVINEMSAALRGKA